MSPKLFAMSRLSLLAVSAMLAVHLATPAGAESMNYDKRGRITYGPSGPNVSYQQGNTRIYVSKRSWLDGGTEVLPGDRKFLDYAFPPGPSFGVTHHNHPTERPPLGPAPD